MFALLSGACSQAHPTTWLHVLKVARLANLQTDGLRVDTAQQWTLKLPALHALMKLVQGSLRIETNHS